MKCKHCRRELIPIDPLNASWFHEYEHGMRFKHASAPTKICGQFYKTIATPDESYTITEILKYYDERSQADTSHPE